MCRQKNTLMPAKLGTNYGTGITRCAVWNRSIISSTNSLETGNSTLIKFPIQHLVHKLRYLLRFRGKRRSKEERLSRQFCTKTKFHIQKKRGTESKTIRVFRLFENRRGKICMSRRCAATGMQRGCSKRVPLRYYARNHAWQGFYPSPRGRKWS